MSEVPHREGFLLNKKEEDKYHTFHITDLLPIPENGLLASAGLDYKICLWHLDTLKPKTVLRGHSRGVHTLDWYPDLHFILSAGYDHDVHIWNPLVNRSVFTLQGHNHSLVGVKWMPGTDQVISADISGTIKIWDVRTFMPLQTLNCNLNEINCLAVTQNPKRIIVGGKTLVFYDYEEPKDYHLADDVSCIAVLYNKVFYTFITAHPKCIKIWDAESGCLKSVYKDISSREITAICMDDRGRKLFVGDQRGRVYCLNVRNGIVKKRFKKPRESSHYDREKCDISSLCYWGETPGVDAPPKNLLITASWDKSMCLYDDNDVDDREGTLRDK